MVRAAIILAALVLSACTPELSPYSPRFSSSSGGRPCAGRHSAEEHCTEWREPGTQMQPEKEFEPW